MTSHPERPQVKQLNTRVNLDEVFGYVCENVISDNVTPYKLIVAELIQLLRELDPCDNVFFREEGIMMQSMIFGLIHREDMPFEDVKRCVRHLDKYVRTEVGIYEPFMERMNAKLGATNTPTKMTFIEPPASTESRRNETKSAVIYRSPLHLFVQKLYVAGCYLTQQQVFEMQEKLREYISGVWPITFKDRIMLPYDINTSIRARQWIRKQMHLLQICPSEAMNEEQLFKWCHDISFRHKDIPEVHLLQMIAHVGNEDFHEAQKSLRRFFDFSVFRPNTGGSQTNPATISRLGVPDQRPFRFGPLLSARLHRVFGDRLMCRQLLQECMREAQASQDNICYKFVYMELILLLCHYYCREEQQLDRHICIPKEPALEKTICMSDVFQLPDRSPSAHTDRDPEEHLHSSEMYLSAATQLAESIERLKYASMDGHDFSNQFADSVTLDDRDGKSRLLHEAGLAVLISFRMKQGFYKSACNIAKALIESNGNDGIAPRHETDAQVIAHINICYADAINGDYPEALRKIEELSQTYSKKVYWRLMKHINLAKSCLKFNDFLRQGKLDDCEEELLNLEKFSYQEWFLKKTLLLAIHGRLEEAINMLEEEKDFFQRTPRLDLTYSSRVYMQLALFESHINTNVADERFNKLLSTLTKSNNRLLYGMVNRRMASASITVGFPHIAIKMLDLHVFDEGFLDKNYFELGLAHLTMGIATLETDTNTCREALNKALENLSRAGWPILEKIVRKTQVKLYEILENDEEYSKSLEAFCKLDDDYPGYIDWTLL